MPSITLPQVEIIYKDVFSMKYLYSVLHLYLEEEGWGDMSSSGLGRGAHEFIETYYLDRKLTPRDIRFWWVCQRASYNPGRAGHDGKDKYYPYKHILQIYGNVINMVDVEVIKEGRKMKVQNGEISIRLNAQVQVADFTKHPILKFADQFFRQRLYKAELAQQKKLLYRDLYQLEAVIKKYLELRIFTPEFRVFHEKFENM